MTPLDLSLRIWCAVLGLACVLRACEGGQASAQASTSPTVVALGRVCANEDSRPLRPVHDGGTAGELTVDCQAIYQVARNVARAKRISVYSAITSLAPHVSGRMPTRNRRHLSFGQLPARGTARPPLWDDARDGPWASYAANWQRFREAVARMMQLGEDGPCEGRPITWGSKQDAKLAIRRGLARVECGDTTNLFFAGRPR